jgi:hypothetical protein
VGVTSGGRDYRKRLKMPKVEKCGALGERVGDFLAQD